MEQLRQVLKSAEWQRPALDRQGRCHLKPRRPLGHLSLEVAAPSALAERPLTYCGQYVFGRLVQGLGFSQR